MTEEKTRVVDKLLWRIGVRNAVRFIGLRAVLAEVRDMCRDETAKPLDVWETVLLDLNATIDAIPEGE